MYVRPHLKLYSLYLFVNDSIGLITSYYAGQQRLCMEYGVEKYDDLHKEITQDSLFFEFKFIP